MLKVNPLKPLLAMPEPGQRNFVGKAHYHLTFYFPYVKSPTAGG